jgi:two-component system response regulator HydG
VNQQATRAGGDILLIDDDRTFRTLASLWLRHGGHRVVEASNSDEALEAVRNRVPDVILLDLHLEGQSGLDVLAPLRRQAPNVPVVMLTADDGLDCVLDATRLGALDYLVKPADQHRLMAAVRNARERARHNAEEAETHRGGHDVMIGDSPAMRALFAQVSRVASTDVTVLIQGESGVGKELVAAALHRAGRRPDGPFVAINCAAIPAGLQESELFGHERGTFTGADQRRIGRFEQAAGGTLFLDEIAELSPGLQASLLRVVQERRFTRVGGREEIEVDVRIVAATHRNLADEVDAGNFRADLYYRLSVYELLVPSLRERRGDIGRLAAHFLAELSDRYQQPVRTLGDGARAILEAYSWPGNVRELRNVVERVHVVTSGPVVTPEDLPARIRQAVSETVSRLPSSTSSNREDDGLSPMERMEKDTIVAALAASRGNATDVIRRLGIPRTTLYRKMERYGIRR